MKYHLEKAGLNWEIKDLTLDNHGTQIL